MNKKFDWRKKTSVLIGRFQPFHDGHYELFLNGLRKSGQVSILVMDSHKVGKKNPLSFFKVKKIIKDKLKNFSGRYNIIKIPMTREIIYGRKVGYKIRNIKLSKKIQLISGTQIRKKFNIT
jgi:phosphopantetheine adenylyltransferase